MTPNSACLLSRPWRSGLGILCGLGAASFVLTLVFEAPTAWRTLLFVSTYLLSVSLMSGVFLAIQYLTHAGWSAVLYIVAESLFACLPLGAVLLLITFIGVPQLFPWVGDEAMMPLIEAKRPWLNPTGLAFRTLLFVVLWIFLGRAMIRPGAVEEKNAWLRKRDSRAALFVVVIALTYSLFSVDWLMSLEPTWYSTLYPWLVMSSAFVGSLSALTLAALGLSKADRLPGFNRHHLHDLGKYILAFGIFWGYLAYSQFMLIWYTNIPEEATHYQLRSGFWLPASILNAGINLIIPFILLPAGAKQSPRIMAGVSALLFVGQGFNFLILVLPSGGAIHPGLLPLIGLTFAGGI